MSSEGHVNHSDKHHYDRDGTGPSGSDALLWMILTALIGLLCCWAGYNHARLSMPPCPEPVPQACPEPPIAPPVKPDPIVTLDIETINSCRTAK